MLTKFAILFATILKLSSGQLIFPTDDEDISPVWTTNNSYPQQQSSQHLHFLPSSEPGKISEMSA